MMGSSSHVAATSAPASSDWRDRILRLPPNRVWRTYPGGRTLDTLAGVPEPRDGAYPEDWLASTTRAINSGRESIVEGVASATVAGETRPLTDWLALDPEYFLGAGHLAKFGIDPRVLVKLLDPAIRLHLQVHPTAKFAQLRLGASSGKTEAYHVLSVRPEQSDPCVYLGFRDPPSRDTLREWIANQDILAIKAAMQRVPVNPGDTLLVPGGVPHALGGGLFLVEIQEPSDLVVRFEFKRADQVLPEAARFMGRDLEFALDVFDFSPWSAGRIQSEARCPPRRRRALGVDSYQDDLIGPERTPCFRLRKSYVRAPLTKTETDWHLLIVTRGSGILRTAREEHTLRTFDRVLVPAGLGSLQFHPTPELELLECYPPV